MHLQCAISLVPNNTEDKFTIITCLLEINT